MRPVSQWCDSIAPLLNSYLEDARGMARRNSLTMIMVLRISRGSAEPVISGGTFANTDIRNTREFAAENSKDNNKNVLVTSLTYGNTDTNCPTLARQLLRASLWLT